MKNFLKNKLDQALRLLYLNSITQINGSIVLVEYPKSGGTWLGQLVSGYLDIPFPKNRFPVLKKSLFHGHYLPKFGVAKNKKVILLVRDGRDVLISFYHHQLIWNDKNINEAQEVRYHQKKLGFENFEDVKGNIKKYMQYSYEDRPSKFRRLVFPGNWYEFNDTWLKKMKSSENIYLVKYEDLLVDPKMTIKKLLEEFLEVSSVDMGRLQSIIDKFSFENQTKRRHGEENKKSFLRKGVSGDWKNYFDNDAKIAFKKYTQNMLVLLGYEDDHDW